MRPILLLILLFIVGQWFVKALRRAQPRPDSHDAGARAREGSGAWRAPNGAGQSALPEPMVRCAECGVHAPRSDSVIVDAHAFCSHEHAHKYAARATGQGRAAR